jgi:hypothetical protein
MNNNFQRHKARDIASEFEIIAWSIFKTLDIYCQNIFEKDYGLLEPIKSLAKLCIQQDGALYFLSI